MYGQREVLLSEIVWTIVIWITVIGLLCLVAVMGNKMLNDYNIRQQ